jgi:large subunit ribosomal protein L25
MPMNRTGLKRLRSSGRLPAIVSSSDTNNVQIHLCAKEFGRWMRTGEGGMIQLNLENHGPMMVSLEAVQRDPVTRDFLHVDFARIQEEEMA